MCMYTHDTIYGGWDGTCYGIPWYMGYHGIPCYAPLRGMGRIPPNGIRDMHIMGDPI